MRRKKTALLVVVLLCMTLFLSACGSSFSIKGKWKNTGSQSYGQAVLGGIVVFDGENCNFLSPNDTYALEKSGNGYQLTVTTLLFNQVMTFPVKVINNDKIEVNSGNITVTLEQVKEN